MEDVNVSGLLKKGCIMAGKSQYKVNDAKKGTINYKCSKCEENYVLQYVSCEIKEIQRVTKDCKDKRL